LAGVVDFSIDAPAYDEPVWARAPGTVRFGGPRTRLAFDAAHLDTCAEALGYCDAASFGRAFKRWTGRSPGQLRR
ncbi:MAG: AraC family transcriptional regulator, partial [Sandaracinaceae bacterium]